MTPALPPARVVSLNLCADQLLLSVADRRQIAALTVYATDPAMSAAAAAARGLATTRGTAEELLALAPDLVLAAPYQVAAKARLLPGVRIVAVPEANDVAAIVANLRTVAAAIGHPARAGPVIVSLGASLPPVVLGRGPIVAHYQRGGYLTGTGTLVDDLLRRAGVRNLAAVLHRPPLSRLSLEEIVAARPDYLLIERRAGTGDRGAALLDHPALAKAFPAYRRLYLDGALTLCGGPAYGRAVTSVRAQVGDATRLVGRLPTPSAVPLPPRVR